MDNLIIPKDYHSELNLHDTQIAIKTVKDFFQGLLALRLNLSRVSAPLFVDPLSGLNDNLNGVERRSPSISRSRTAEPPRSFSRSPNGSATRSKNTVFLTGRVFTPT